MSTNILWDMKYDPQIIIIRYVQIRMQMWINVKIIRFERTSNKRGKTMDYRMKRGGELDDDVATIKEAFDLFDKDSDGTIELSELKAVVNDLGRCVSDEELETLMKDVDADGNGSIDFDEFCQ